jgi:hypothetical protein
MLITLRFSNNRFFSAIRIDCDSSRSYLPAVQLKTRWTLVNWLWLLALLYSCLVFHGVIYRWFSVINLKGWLLSTWCSELSPSKSNGWWSLRCHSWKLHQRKNFMSINVMRVEVDKKRAKRKRKHLQLVYPVMKITLWTNHKENSSSRLSDRRQRDV